MTNNNGMPEEVTMTPSETSDVISLKYLDKDLFYECMSVPSKSNMEERMVTYVMLFCKKNNVKYEFDSYGNIYLTKGELSDGEFYPCVTSHLDTVQSKHEPYILSSVNLELKTSLEKNGTHKVYCDDIGIGADDKGGILICLSLFLKKEKLKACFFLQEEIGCLGSQHLEKEWFKDVGYVIGYDSPERNRAAWSCSQTKLFSYDFYLKHLKPVCDKFDMTRFESEPFTDVKQIREQTGIVCMNFGNGGYLAHNQTSEYVIIEDMDTALGMGEELIDALGFVQYKMENKTEYGGGTITVTASDGNNCEVVDNYDDTKKLKTLGKYQSYTYPSYSSNSSAPSKDETDKIKYSVLKYVVDRYELYVSNLKGNLTESIKALCEQNGIASDDFVKAISDSFNKEITF